MQVYSEIYTNAHTFTSYYIPVCVLLYYVSIINVIVLETIHTNVNSIIYASIRRAADGPINTHGNFPPAVHVQISYIQTLVFAPLTPDCVTAPGQGRGDKCFENVERKKHYLKITFIIIIFFFNTSEFTLDRKKKEISRYYYNISRKLCFERSILYERLMFKQVVYIYLRVIYSNIKKKYI